MSLENCWSFIENPIDVIRNFWSKKNNFKPFNIFSFYSLRSRKFMAVNKCEYQQLHAEKVAFYTHQQSNLQHYLPKYQFGESNALEYAVLCNCWLFIEKSLYVCDHLHNFKALVIFPTRLFKGVGENEMRLLVFRN